MLFEKLKKFADYPSRIINPIEIDSKKYPLTIQGKGEVPCLSVGGSTVVQRTLSPKFKKIFTYYCCDYYWIERDKINDFSNFSIVKIVEDIISTIDQLGLKQLILFGHSAFGIIALEVAKRQDPRIIGVIMVGTPTNSNLEVANKLEKYFIDNASAERKIDDVLRKKCYNQNKAQSESFLLAYEANSARYWSNYKEINFEFLANLWRGVEYNDNILNFFFNKVLPNHKTEIGIEKVKVPVILMGGRYDYDCLPLELWKNFAKPRDFTIVDCGEVGHWPQIENEMIFDEEIDKWLKLKVFK